MLLTRLAFQLELLLLNDWTGSRVGAGLTQQARRRVADSSTCMCMLVSTTRKQASNQTTGKACLPGPSLVASGFFILYHVLSQAELVKAAYA